MEPITILVPTYNRSRFLPLFLMNLISQDYPHNLLNVIILDDGEDWFIKDEDELQKVKEHIYPISLTYVTDKHRKTIGKKRDTLIKMCNTKVFCFLDDDDAYMPTYISYSYEMLKTNKYGCVGSDKMLFCMTDRNFSVHMIDCGNTKHLIHEATLMATKKWYRASCGFANSSQGEGANLFHGMERKVGITDIFKIMVCIQHGQNTVSKLQFARDDNRVNLEISEEFKNGLKQILNLKD